jgi:hypothetical protein
MREGNWVYLAGTHQGDEVIMVKLDESEQYFSIPLAIFGVVFIVLLSIATLPVMDAEESQKPFIVGQHDGMSVGYKDGANNITVSNHSLASQPIAYVHGYEQGYGIGHERGIDHYKIQKSEINDIKKHPEMYWQL